MMAIGLFHYLAVAAVLFTIGVLRHLRESQECHRHPDVDRADPAGGEHQSGLLFGVSARTSSARSSPCSCLTVAAAEAAVGLAILVTFFRNRGDIAVDDASDDAGLGVMSYQIPPSPSWGGTGAEGVRVGKCEGSVTVRGASCFPTLDATRSVPPHEGEGDLSPQLLVTLLVFAPLLGAIVAGLFGRRIGDVPSMVGDHRPAVPVGLRPGLAGRSPSVIWGGLEPQHFTVEIRCRSSRWANSISDWSVRHRLGCRRSCWWWSPRVSSARPPL